MQGFTGCDQGFFNSSDEKVRVEGGYAGLRGRITRLRCDKNLYQYAVAEKAGMTPDVLSHLLNGKGRITGEKLEALAKALRVPVGQLIGDVPGEKKKECSCRKEAVLPEWLLCNAKAVGELIIGQQKKFEEMLPDGFVCPVCGGDLVKQGEKDQWYRCPGPSCGFTVPGEDAEECLRVLNLGLALAAAMCKGPENKKENKQESEEVKEHGDLSLKAAIRRVVTLVRATEQMNLEGSAEVRRLVGELLWGRALDLALAGGVSIADVFRLRDRLMSGEGSDE